MLEQEFHISQLIKAYLNGELNPVQEQELQAWLAASPENRELLNSLSNEQELSRNIRDFEEVDSARLWERATVLLQLNRAPKTKAYQLWPRIATVAAAVATIVFGVWFFNRNSDVINTGQAEVAYTNDLAPGKNTATITLENGEVINLDSNRNNVVVTDSVKAATNLVAATPRGGTYQLVLSDGTHVWLNAESKISFPSQFKGTERKILLDGEAYFEVAKNEKLPFVVESKGQELRVLGTHFNVNAYSDEKINKTTLLEGSVKVSLLRPLEGAGSVILQPGQQSSAEGGGIKVKNVDAESAIAWKEGLFQFERADIKTVMTQLARWYDVEVEYEGNLPEREFTGKIYRNIKASQALELLKNLQVKFRIEGRKIIVTR